MVHRECAGVAVHGGGGRSESRSSREQRCGAVIRAAHCPLRRDRVSVREPATSSAACPCPFRIDSHLLRSGGRAAVRLE